MPFWGLGITGVVPMSDIGPWLALVLEWLGVVLLAGVAIVAGLWVEMRRIGVDHAGVDGESSGAAGVSSLRGPEAGGGVPVSVLRGPGSAEK